MSGTIKADPVGIWGKMTVGVQMGTRRNVPSCARLYTHNRLILYSNGDHRRGPSYLRPVQPSPTPERQADQHILVRCVPVCFRSSEIAGAVVFYGIG